MNLRVHKMSIVCLAAVVIVLGAVFAAPAGAATVVDFTGLKEEAPDSVAWLQLAGTKINYPVMHGTDNDFYMNHLPDGRESRGGAIFLDYRNSPGFVDPNSVVHGHRMDTGAMFGALKSYVLQEYYDRHQIVTLITPEKNVDVHLFAGYVFDQTEESVPISFGGTDSFNSFVQLAKERSMFTSNVEVNPGDLLVTLITCDYGYDDGRLMLIGKQLN